MLIKFTSIFVAFTLAFHVHLALARNEPLIENFPTCDAFNDYYIGKLLPLVGPFGLTSSNAYTPTRSSPKNSKSTRPGGPSGLPFRRLPRDPKRVAFSNITKGVDDILDDDDDGPVAGVDFSTTNVQVRGVDEPDIIKTDGKRVFTLSGDIFSVVKVLDDGASGKRTGKLRLPSYPDEMLIEGDWVLIIGSDFEYKRPVYQRYKEDPSTGEQSTVIYQVNVAGPKPRLVATLNLEGQYVKSRETKGIARLVMRFNPLDTIWLYSPRGKVTRKQTRKWNREIIQYSRPENWLPTYRLRRRGEVQHGVYATCGDVFHSPTVFSGYQLLTVVTLPVDGLLSPGSSASIISDAETIYSNKKSMYVTTSEFRFDDLSDDDSRWGANYQTSIHKFNLTDDGAKYIASGSVTGSIINQFAMHEFKDTFFVATTDGAAWWSNRDLTASKVTSFVPNEATRVLKKVDEVGNLGVGERIFSVRYVLDTAYVVTFRETDPLYIIDLSNPSKLKVTGELKIPGFSSYLHPVAPGRILGVGQEATLSGVTTGAKVSLFDVSDKTDPKELSTWTLSGSYSNVEWDHRAFLYWPRERVAVMPVNVYSRRTFTGAVVLDITETEIKERGRVMHNIPAGFTPSIERNAIIGGVHLWSMSTEVLQVNNLNKLNKVEAQVPITS